jgi:hypothetical protein
VKSATFQTKKIKKNGKSFEKIPANNCPPPVRENKSFFQKGGGNYFPFWGIPQIVQKTLTFLN